MIEHATLAAAQARSLERPVPPPPVVLPRARLGERLRHAYASMSRVLARASASALAPARKAEDCPECA